MLQMSTLALEKVLYFDSLHRFVAAVVDIFEGEYLRYPNETDTARLLAMGE